MTRTPLSVFLLVCTLPFTGCGGCNGDKAGQPPAPVAAPATPAEGPRETPAGAGEPIAEVDCFVIVDAEPDFGAPPLTVHFTTETDCTGSPVTFSWDFGDGTKGGNDPKPSHTYATAGDYIATVTATAPDGGTGTDEIDITVDQELAD